MQTKQFLKNNRREENKVLSNLGINYSLKTFLLLFILFFSISLSSATSFGYNYLDNQVTNMSGANFSVNVNNTEHLQGRDTNQLYLYFKSLYDTVYCKLTGCTMTGSISNATSYGLYTAYTPTGLEPTGTTYYDNASHTVSTVLEGGVIVQQGQELHVYGKNAGGVIIHNGDAVSITNVGGSFTTFGLTNGTDPVSAYAFVGLATQDIGVNDFGYVTSRGVVRDINTNSWTEGLPLYVNTSSPGHLTQTYPSAPNFIINVGVVEYKSINHGRINVVPVVVPRLQDLSDVDGYPLNSTGQIYVWNQTRKLFDSNFNLYDLHVGNITYDDVYYDDEKANFASSTRPVSNSIVQKVWKGSIESWAFEEKNAALQQSAMVDLQYSHRRKTNSSIECHIHFNTPTASTNNVTFYLEYNCGSVNGNYSTNNFNVTKTFQLNNVAYSAQLGDFGSINSYCNDGLSMIQKNYIKRLSADPTDTYTGDVFADYFDCHFQIDSPGSRQEYVK